jgi:hypothetical protein
VTIWNFKRFASPIRWTTTILWNNLNERLANLVPVTQNIHVAPSMLPCRHRHMPAAGQTPCTSHLPCTINSWRGSVAARYARSQPRHQGSPAVSTNCDSAAQQPVSSDTDFRSHFRRRSLEATYHAHESVLEEHASEGQSVSVTLDTCQSSELFTGILCLYFPLA